MPARSGSTCRDLLDRWLSSQQAWLEATSTAWRLVPEFLVQPVNPGWMFGNIPVVRDNFSLITLGIVFVSVLPMAVEFVRVWLKKRKT